MIKNLYWAAALSVRRPLGLLWAIVFSIAFSLVQAGCSRPPTHELVLNDFETDADLDRIHWQCRTLFSLSIEHVTSGGHCLKMELFPADYPGLSLKLDEHDWSRFGNVVFDIFNLQDETLEITVRIDDRPDYPDYADRYNGRHALLPGGNHIRIPMSSLRTSGSGQPLWSLEVMSCFVKMTDQTVGKQGR